MVSAHSAAKGGQGVGRRYLVGMSTKMYFSHARTLQWCREAVELSRVHPAVLDGRAELFVLPGFLSVAEVVSLLDSAGLAGMGDGPWSVGAQDVCWAESGAYTGEVSAAQLAEVGVRYVEVGHAERRRLFGEDEGVVAAKTAAILRHGLTPVLCIGETERVSPPVAVEVCLAQIASALGPARAAGCFGRHGRVVVAYEPVWAIGASEPASVEHIVGVCGPLREALTLDPDYAGDVIYGGSAGPGLLREVGEHVDGLFLGRFAHDPQAIKGILDDVLALAD